MMDRRANEPMDRQAVGGSQWSCNCSGNVLVAVVVMVVVVVVQCGVV